MGRLIEIQLVSQTRLPVQFRGRSSIYFEIAPANRYFVYYLDTFQTAGFPLNAFLFRSPQNWLKAFAQNIGPIDFQESAM